MGYLLPLAAAVLPAAGQLFRQGGLLLLQSLQPACLLRGGCLQLLAIRQKRDAFLFHHYSLSRNISNLISKHSCLDQATWIPWWQIIIIDCLTLTEQRKIHYCHLTYFIKQTITISAQISVLESCMCTSFSLTFRHTQQIYWFKFIWLPHFIFMHTACLGNVLSV